jgi:hypothetical protein
MVRKVGEELGLKFGEDVHVREFSRPFHYWPLSWTVAALHEKRTVHEGERLVENTPEIHRTIRLFRNLWAGIKLGLVAGLIGGGIAWRHAAILSLGQARLDQKRDAVVAEAAGNEQHLLRGIRFPFESRKERIRKAYAKRMEGLPRADRDALDQERRREIDAVTREEEQALREYRSQGTQAACEAFEAARRDERLSDAQLRKRAGIEALGWNLETARALRETFPWAQRAALKIAGLAALVPFLTAVARRRMRARFAVSVANRRRRRRLRKTPPHADKSAS